MSASFSVPHSAITEGPHIQWNHIDGPLMTWAGLMHWLTWRERFSLWIGSRTIDEVATDRWPHLDRLRRALSNTGQTE